ncbi:TonB-dependent receptor [Pedobacter heparinus]|uniref:SusC/RagA family TonB-linked outer membrane protein n=1 Tax=Pedobacter heparinus TaxID=984 RepID=UPI00292F3BAC|nr:TonB-dependent receptor [Pedobacter heparinus]
MKTNLPFNYHNRWIYIVLLLCYSLASFSQERTGSVNGVVRDESGKALPFVSVLAKNSLTNLTSGAQTDSNGMFKFFKLPVDGTYSFTFSSIGYETQTLSGYKVPVNGSNSIMIKLIGDSKELNQVVIVGYGSQRKLEVSSSIASIKPDKIDKGAINDPIKLLQGRTTGVNILTPSGTPGTKAIVQVRGVSSISGGSSPLYVVDGVPFDVTPNLNPGDIESIEALKDAAASAIYGSRANGGVIIVTTKSGKEGKTKVGLNYLAGKGNIHNDIPVANTAQYISVMQDAVSNYNAQKGTNMSLYIPPNPLDVDWGEYITRNSAFNSRLELNLSGGNSTTNVFTSFGAYTQQGILKNSHYEQYNYRLNANHVANKYATFHASLSGSYTPQRLLEETSTSLKPLYYTRTEQPWYAPYLDDGNYTVAGIDGIRNHNPVMIVNEEIWKQRSSEIIGRVSLDLKPLKGLTFTPSVSGYGNLFINNKKLTAKMAARNVTAGNGAVLENRNIQYKYVIDNVLNYKNNIGKLDYTVLAGHSFEKYVNDKSGMYSSNYANQAFPSENLDAVNAGTNIFPDVITYDTYALDSYFGRMTLVFDKRFIFNGSLRYDGSSVFSESKRYGVFPSFSLGWQLINESFMKESSFGSLFSDLKLRTSYGVTGSQAGIGYYANQSLVSGGNSYNNQGGLRLSQIAQNVTWEKGKQFNLGLDVEIFNGRVGLTADYFYQKTTNLLYNKPVYATTGYSTVAANIGALQNKGFELGINSKILQGELKWDVSANISIVSNKLLSLYDGSNQFVIPGAGSTVLAGGSGIHALINGKPISAFYLLKQTGIYQYDTEVPAKLLAKGIRAGDIIYQDVNGDGDISAADRQYVGKATPDLYGGFTSSLSYKGFDLNVFAQYSVGAKVFANWKGGGPEGSQTLGNTFSSVVIPGGGTAIQFSNIDEYAATHYWKGPGTSNFMPRAIMGGFSTGYTNGYNQEPSSHFLQDASYLRIKTMTLGYQLPAAILNKLKVESIRIYTSVDNLWTLTKYDGYDPEQSYVTNPGDPNYGVDFGLQPALRTFILGINIKF